MGGGRVLEEIRVHFGDALDRAEGGAQMRLHRGLGVVAFADGHVESHKWVDPRTCISLSGSQTYLPHGVSSPGNKDLIWLGARATMRP